MKKEGTMEYIEYCIFLEGEISLPFDSVGYTPEGAIKRYFAVAKDFNGVRLVARKNGITFIIYPTKEQRESRRREIQRKRNTFFIK